MPLIGTAGHVDHGKSTLIQRLTGRDPDRWAEEKRRGLTIDLGFSWASLPGGEEVSFVDVPGHERYLKNMLAGIEAIDVALFVVAADEGWMPQSEEHLAVLDLLDVGAGVVALTKTDTVESDLVELATLEIQEMLAGTTLQDAQIIPVSGTTGDGIEALVSALERHVEDVGSSSDSGRPRLWVDRSFSASGAGTVVTGTLLEGSLEVGDAITTYPDGRAGRIRGIQSHEQSHEMVTPGRRVALNLAGIAHDEVERGDMIGRPGDWESTARFSASVQLARYVDELEARGAYQIHIGTTVDQAELVGVDEGLAVMKLSSAVPAAVGDRFILRDTGRKLVVAGGRILDPSPGPTRKALYEARSIDPTSGADAIATRLLEVRGVDKAIRLERHTLGGRAAGVESGDWVLARSELERLTGEALRHVEHDHDQHPLRDGLSIATLAGLLGVAQEVAETIVELSDALDRTGPDVFVQGRSIEIPPEKQAEWERARRELARGLAIPTVDELDLDPELLHLLVRNEELTRVSEELIYLPEQIDRLIEIARSMSDAFTVADFRDAAGLSRKYAVPILEWMDREAITVRRGDTRRTR